MGLARKKNNKEARFQDDVVLSRRKNSKDKPIWEKILAIAASIPDEELEKLPRDGAENLDHYLYGGDS